MAAALLTGQMSVAGAGTLDKVRARGHVVCGVSNSVPGFSAADAKGKWVGFDVDLCRALAAAIFADGGKVTVRPLEAGEGLTALRQGEIDILTRPTDRTLELEANGSLVFVGTSFFDGLVLLAPKALGLDSALQLSGARVCLAEQPRLRQGLAAFFGQRKMHVEVKAFDHASGAIAAYEAHQCEALSEELSRLPALRAALKDPWGQMQLAPLLTVHSLGPVVRQGDESWRRIAQWTLQVMISAEQAGLDQAEAKRAATQRSPLAAQLLAAAADLGPQLGLPANWAEAMIGEVGNYGEAFERNLGPGSPAGLERGLNNLWSAGGLVVAPSLR